MHPQPVLPSVWASGMRFVARRSPMAYHVATLVGGKGKGLGRGRPTCTLGHCDCPAVASEGQCCDTGR